MDFQLERRAEAKARWSGVTKVGIGVEEEEVEEEEEEEVRSKEDEEEEEEEEERPEERNAASHFLTNLAKNFPAPVSANKRSLTGSRLRSASPAMSLLLSSSCRPSLLLLLQGSALYFFASPLSSATRAIAREQTGPYGSESSDGRSTLGHE